MKITHNKETSNSPIAPLEQLPTSNNLNHTINKLDHLLHLNNEEDQQSEYSIAIKNKNRHNHQPPSTTSRDVERILSIHNITKALGGWNASDLIDLDYRTYFFTIPLDGFYDIGGVSNAIYSRIRKQVGFQDNAVKIGMIIGLDFNGARSRTVHYQDHLNPHLHAIVFLPRCVAPATKDHEQSILNGWRTSISQLHEVNNRSLTNEEEFGYNSKVFVQRFAPTKSIIHTVGYGQKADSYYNDRLNNKTEIVTFPYKKNYKGKQVVDVYESESNLDLTFRLHLFPETIFSDRHPSDLTVWQRYHRQRYTEARSSEDRVTERNRFLSRLGVGPYSQFQRSIRNELCVFSGT